MVYVGISGSISLFPVLVSDLFGKSALGSKSGLLNTTVGLSILTQPSAINAIIGAGPLQRWTIEVPVACLTMFAGGLMLPAASAVTERGCYREDEA